MSRSIIKAITFYFRNLEPTQSLHSFILSFLTFTVDLAFGKILKLWDGKSHKKVNYPYSYNSCAKGFI